MSFTKAQFKETAKSMGAALLTTVFMVANANAADVRELDSINLTRPIPTGTCVTDSRIGKAYDKIEAIKTARNQKDIIEADEPIAKDAKGNNLTGIVFTSNLTASGDKKSVFGEGYVISSNAPKGQKGSTYCITISNDTTQLASAITGTKPPNLVNKGEMAVALNNAMVKANSRVGYVAVTHQDLPLAVNFNYNTGEGGFIVADANGNTPLPAALVNVAYSPSLPLAYQKALGMPERVSSGTPERVAGLSTPNLALNK